MQWPRPSSGRFDQWSHLQGTAGLLKPGDVIWVANAIARACGATPTGPTQRHEVQWLAPMTTASPRRAPQLRPGADPARAGRVFSYDHQSGYVTTMVGASTSTVRNSTAVQACGSPARPTSRSNYSLALDRGYATARAQRHPARKSPDYRRGLGAAEPEQHRRVQVNLEYALVFEERALGAVVQAGGAKDVELGAPLGMTPRSLPTSAGTGASCTRIDELTRAFSALPATGR